MTVRTILPYFTLFLCFFGTRSFGQVDFTQDYYPIQVSGSIPQDFTALSYPQVDSAIATVTERNWRDRDTKERFLLNSQYQIDDMLRSGMVLFGDPMTKYVNKVADQILKDDPKLRSKLRFYVVKSEEVNAFSTNQGIIFVTVGMLAKINNEAQLGFVLSHEIVHYLKNHTIDSYVAYEHMMRNARQNYSGIDGLVRAMSGYSKTLEFEADIEGLDIFLESGYNPKAAEYIFNVFEASHMPFDNQKWTIDWFSEGEFKLPMKLHQDKIKTVEASADRHKEKFSSHPDAGKRRDAIKSILVKKTGLDGKDFIQPEAVFREVQEIARFELVRYYMQNRRFVKSLYTTFLLQEKYPENKYLQTYKVKALYSIARYREAGQYQEVIPSYRKVEGESQRMYFALREIDVADLYLLVVREAWKFKQMEPETATLRNICDDAAMRLIGDFDLKLDSFQTTTYTEEIQRVISFDVDSLWNADRIEFIRKKEEAHAETLSQTEVETSLLPNTDAPLNQNAKAEEQLYNAQHDTVGRAEFLVQYYDQHVPRKLFVYQHLLVANDDFAGYYTSMEDSVNTVRTAKEEYNSLSLGEKRKIANKQRQVEQRYKNRGYRLGIDTVMMLSPIYFRADLSQGNMKYIYSEKKQRDFVETVEKSADDLGLSVEMLDIRSLTLSDAKKFNDMVLIHDWIEERYAHKEVDMAFTGMENGQEVADRRGSRYVVINAVLSTEEKRRYSETVMLCGCLTVYLGLPALLYGATKMQRTIIVTLVLDIVTGEEMLVYSKMIKKKDRKDLVHGHIYNTLLQIHRDPK